MAVRKTDSLCFTFIIYHVYGTSMTLNKQLHIYNCDSNLNLVFVANPRVDDNI